MKTEMIEDLQREVKLLEPLKEVYCDFCGRIIYSRKDVLVEFYHSEGNGDMTGPLRIVHRTAHRYSNGRDCLAGQDPKAGIFVPLEDYVMQAPAFEEEDSPRGDFFRRLTYPYYEQARQYLHLAWADDWFQLNGIKDIYAEDTLKFLIAEYSNCHVPATKIDYQFLPSEPMLEELHSQ